MSGYQHLHPHHHVQNSVRERNRSFQSQSTFPYNDVQDPGGVVRKIRPINSAADHAELEKHYSFLPPLEPSSWQDRMVEHYHSHLYKEFVLADLTRQGQVGLRWRTQNEVKQGKGQVTCGNKHCQSYHLSQNERIGKDDCEELVREYARSQTPTTECEEQILLEKLPHGVGLHDYEVPFTYEEHGASKTELVKLRLCLRCAPLLFRKKTCVNCALKARHARLKFERHCHEGNQGNQKAETKVQRKHDDKGTRIKRDVAASFDDSSSTEEDKKNLYQHRNKKKKRTKKS